MEELKILKYQAEQIEDTFRLIKNAYKVGKKDETCLDRQILKSIEMIKSVLTTAKE